MVEGPPPVVSGEKTLNDACPERERIEIVLKYFFGRQRLRRRADIY